MTKLRSSSAFFVFVAAFSPLSVTHAHHGAANYDRTRQVVVEGVVRKVDWRNPHIFLAIEMAGEQGEPVAEHREGLGFGLPSGLGKHLVERLALDADGRHLNYEIMAEDPEYLTEPIHAAAKWEYRPDLEPSGAECDLESARRFLEEQ